MATLEQRLQALEARMLRADAASPPKFVWVSFGETHIKYCFPSPPRHIRGGLGAFYDPQNWRYRDTCPEVDDCEYADCCDSQGAPFSIESGGN